MSASDEARARFQTEFGGLPVGLAIAPGRVNIIGEHVDYNGGLALPCAIQLSAALAVRPAEVGQFVVIAADLEAKSQFSLKSLEARRSSNGAPLPEWSRYFAGVVWALRRAGFQVPGMQAVLKSDIPVGAGLSSSAALEVAAATALQALGDFELTPLEMAKICQRAENEYVGVSSGLMDQWTVTHGQQDHALLLDFADLSSRPIPLPQEIALVIADSGLRRTLSDSVYSQRVEECQRVLAAFKEADPELEHLGQASMEQLDKRRRALAPELYQRGRHVISEVQRVREVVEMLEAGQAASIGPLLLQSHASLRDDYAVSSDELDLMVEIAAGLQGCFGARLTGAGFGGCTINWVDRDRAEGFVDKLLHEYQRRTGRDSQAWICHAVGSARWLAAS
ncbi:MAG: galactokinase [Anaerolineales bacterium]